MRFAKKNFRLSIILSTFIISLFISCKDTPKDPVNIGEKAPEFTLPDYNGKKVNLIDFKGKVVLVEFWASWCIPCRESIPYLNSIYQRYKDRDFVLLGINVDESNHAEKIKSFATEYGIKYKILFSDDLTARLYNVSAIPVGYLLDKDQIVVNKYFGHNPKLEKDISDDIRRLL